jgi:hypothetical protein
MHYKSILIVCGAVALATAGGAAYGDEFIKGGVTDLDSAAPSVPMATPVLAPEGGQQTDSTSSNPLTGHAQQTPLNGNADDNARHHPYFLQGQENSTQLPAMAQEDPDAGDQQLSIDWDNWRNRFIFQVQDNLTREMNNNPNVLIWNAAKRQMVEPWPLGTMCWFYCSVLPNRRIINLRIVHPSGYPTYDQAVLQAVNELNGNPILDFPPRSKRGVVTQVAGIKTATSTIHRYTHFHDVERREVP